jgi:hypothetical protein
MKNCNKPFLFATTLILLSLFLLPYPARAEEKWLRIVQSASKADYFIDANTLTYQRGFIAVAWYKVVENKKAKSGLGFSNVKTFAYDFSDLAYSKMLCEINCSSKKLRTLVITAHDKNGELLHRDETLSGSWTDIPKGSCFDSIREIVCTR